MLNAINIFGDYQFDDLLAVPVLTVTGYDLYTAINNFAAEAQKYLNELTGSLVDDESDLVAEQTGGMMGGELQEMSDIVGMEATRIGEKWDTGFPIAARGDRIIYTKSYLERALVQDLNAHVVNVVIKDTESHMKNILRAVMRKTNYTFNDSHWPGRNAGSVTVRRLANADGSAGSVYIRGNKIAIGSLNHYITSGASSIAAGDFDVLYDKLLNVGHIGRPIYVVGPTTGKAVRALTGFIAAPNVLVQPGTNTAIAIVSSPHAIGTIAFGEVQVWDFMPEGYIFAYDASKPKPVRRRVSDIAEYRGLKMITPDNLPEIPTQPLLNKQWRTVYGYAVKNRFNGVCMQITTSGTYTDPTI